MEDTYRKTMIKKSQQELVDNLVELNKYIGIQSVEIKRLHNLIRTKEGIIVELEEQVKSMEDAGISGNTLNISKYYNKKKRKLRLDNIKDDELIRLYVNDNVSVYGIAKLTGYNYMTIRHRLIRAGVYIEGGHKKKGDINDV